MYGRTNSPARRGITRIAKNPIQETATMRRKGTSAIGVNKCRHRVARVRWKTIMSAT